MSKGTDEGLSGDPIGERYGRQLRLPGFTAAHQRRLGAARVAVIGAGGLGSPVLAYLAAAGVGTAAAGGRITVIDADVVDLSNLHRQVIHADAAVGLPKADSAARRMREINPEVRAVPVPRVLEVGSALALLRDHDLVIDGSDNFPTRYLVSDACELLDIPLVWGSILAFAGQVSVFAADGGRGVTYRDLHPVPPGPGEVPSCAEAGVLGMLCGVIGSVMALEAVKEITGLGQSLRGRVAVLDALSMRWAELPVARDPQRPPVRALEDLTLTCGLPGPDGGAAAREADPGGEPDGKGPAGPDGPDGPEREVDPGSLAQMRAAGARLIDIREDHEVAGGMLPGAEHIPVARLLAAADPDLEGAVLYCAAGRRSEAARTALAARGIRVSSLRGGYAGATEGRDGDDARRPG